MIINLHPSLSPLEGRMTLLNIPLRVPTLRDRGVYTLNIDYNISKLLKMSRLLIKLTLSSLLAKVIFQFF